MSRVATVRCLMIAAAVLASAACGSTSEPAPAEETAPETAPDVVETAPEPVAPTGVKPPNHPPVGTKPAGHPPTAPTVAVPPPAKGELSFEIPAGWKMVTPESRMRKAQFLLAGPEDSPEAMLVVFVFPGGGGGIQANLDRWAGQFESADGGPVGDAAKITKREVDGMPLHLLDVSGRYVAETSPGSGNRVNQTDARMLAAIIVSGHGSYFVKLIGPKPTVDHWAESFHAYVDSARK